VGIIEDGLTLEAPNLPCPFAVPRPDIINHPLVYADSVREGPVGVPTGFLNHLSFHRYLHFECRIFVSGNVLSVIHRDIRPGISSHCVTTHPYHKSTLGTPRDVLAQRGMYGIFTKERTLLGKSRFCRRDGPAPYKFCRHPASHEPALLDSSNRSR
jgi:hypothetical protein